MLLLRPAEAGRLVFVDLTCPRAIRPLSDAEVCQDHGAPLKVLTFA